MSNKAPVIAGQINHVKIIVLAVLASIAIMLVGFNARATDDTKGYGLVQVSPARIISPGTGG
ncbi:MAG: hypothetical protein R3D62_22545 [Xanthobacteraceae bacterium]